MKLKLSIGNLKAYSVSLLMLLIANLYLFYLGYNLYQNGH